MTRPSREERIFMELELLSYWVTCRRLRTAAAIVDIEGSVRASGFNGAPRGIQHCNTRPRVEGRCPWCVHSEKNAINQAARTGVQTQGTTIYTLHRPCVSCTNDIVQAGIIRVVYRWAYDSDGMSEYVHDLFSARGRSIQQKIMSPIEQRYSEALVQVFAHTT